MKLARAAQYFDDTDAADAYNAAVTFKVQYEPLAYSKVDGVAIRKRSISTAPDLSMPTRGVIKIDGINYLVGYSAPDFWKGQVIRKNYAIQDAEAQASYISIPNELSGLTRTLAHTGKVFAKYTTDSRESSEYWPQYQLFFDGSENVTAQMLVEISGAWFLVKESYISQAGLRVAFANELAGTVFETIPYLVRTYVPATDTWTETTKTVKVLRVRWTEHFRFLTKATENYDRGDLQIFVLKTAMTPKVSDKLTLSDGAFSILSVQDEVDFWSCHVRR